MLRLAAHAEQEHPGNALEDESFAHALKEFSEEFAKHMHVTESQQNNPEPVNKLPSPHKEERQHEQQRNQSPGLPRPFLKAGSSPSFEKADFPTRKRPTDLPKPDNTLQKHSTMSMLIILPIFFHFCMIYCNNFFFQRCFGRKLGH